MTISDKLVDRICFAVCNTHDTSELWAHAKRDPEAFRSAVRSVMKPDRCTRHVGQPMLETWCVPCLLELVDEVRRRLAHFGITGEDLVGCVADLGVQRNEAQRLASDLEADATAATAEIRDLHLALMPLVRIADAFDDNELDDEARKFWGENHEHQFEGNPDTLELYSGRGGRRLLTLGDCFRARNAVRKP